MEKKIIIGVCVLLVIFGVLYFLALSENFEEESETDMVSFVECLKERGVVVYGSSTCPACTNLVEEYGGIEVIEPIYLDCSGFGEEGESARCQEEMKTNYVPEIQINGEVLEEWGSPEVLQLRTGCEL